MVLSTFGKKKRANPSTLQTLEITYVCGGEGDGLKVVKPGVYPANTKFICTAGTPTRNPFQDFTISTKH